jgi:hypothetical protein
LPDGESEIFLARGLDNPNHVESPEQIAVLAHANFRASRLVREASLRKNRSDLPVVEQIKAGAMTGRQNQIAASLGDGLNSAIVADDLNGPDAPCCTGCADVEYWARYKGAQRRCSITVALRSTCER